MIINTIIIINSIIFIIITLLGDLNSFLQKSTLLILGLKYGIEIILYNRIQLLT